MIYSSNTTFRSIPLVAATAATAAVLAGLFVGACRQEPDERVTQRATPTLFADASAGMSPVLFSGAVVQDDRQYVNADTLKRQAIGALKSGQFDETQSLLEQALKLRPDDPSLRQMDEWIANFQHQREQFDADRQKAYKRQVKDVKLLQEAGFRSYAITAANAAQSYLAPDVRKKFSAEPWIRELVAESEKLGHDYETRGEWLRAMRVWGDLAAIEELNPLWQQNLKGATRRVRLLAVYAPEVLIELRDSTQAEREAVDKLLRESRAADKAAAGDPVGDPELAEDEAKDDADATTEPDENADDGETLDEAFKTDWRNALSGITLTMLRDALEDARQFYVRPVEFRDMLVGGLDAMLAVATTPGLERAFPSLSNEDLKKQFVDDINRQKAELEATPVDRVGGDTAETLLRWVSALNNRTLALPDEVVVSEFADGSLSVLDPFTAMIWPSQVAEFKKGTQGAFVGVGIQIRSEDTGELRVVSPLPGGPAEASGIKYGDVITRIDGKSAHGITDTQAVDVITGNPGSKVVLTIKSMNGDVKDHELVRQQIIVRSVKGWRQNEGDKWDWMVDRDAGIGYLRLTNFQSGTAQELASALGALKREGASAIILDLRYNPGGLLQSAVDVSDRFLTNGVVVSTRGERGDASRPTVLRAWPQASDVDVPMVVLVNEYSASASEIVSGALKDLDRALIVGKRTFGKGSVQMLYPLGGRGEAEAWLKLTTSLYYLPSGKSIHKDELDTEWGVDPDVPVEMTPQQMRDAISARQAMDVLRDDGSKAMVKLDDSDEEVDAEKALLATDAQLSAAILLLRMQLAGEKVM